MPASNMAVWNLADRMLDRMMDEAMGQELATVAEAAARAARALVRGCAERGGGDPDRAMLAVCAVMMEGVDDN